MSVIKINQFGGVMPSVESRNLPPESAQVAHNLDLRFGDFRPLRAAGASVATVTAGTKTIFKTPAGTWLSSVNDVNYVNSQIYDSTLTEERVYLTGRSDYPEAWQNDAYRRLGVPTPTVAPLATRVEKAEFSQQDWDASAGQIVDAVVAFAEAARSSMTLGNGIPANGGTLGGVWLAYGADSELRLSSSKEVAYAVPATGTGAGLTITAASDAYLLDATLGGYEITYSASPYWVVQAPWQGTGYTIDVPTLTTNLKTLKKPTIDGSAPTEQLFSDAVALAIAEAVLALYASTSEPAASYIRSINTDQTSVVTQILRLDSDSNRAVALRGAATNLVTSIGLLNTYFADLNKALKNNIGNILRPYSYLLPAATAIVLETRAYIYTYVTDWGEESAPSPPSVLLTDLDQNDWAEIVASAPAVSSPPYGSITHWRLYRSSTTTVGAAYQLVPYPDEDVPGVRGFPIGSLTQTDDNLQEELEEVCPTLTWAEPPETLIGLIGLPNGIMAGFFGKTLCFCEPYHPYAWPVEYQQTVEYNIVGLGIFGQTLVVLTEGNPYFFSGADSASMSGQKLESIQACMSKRSIVSVEGGVIYASPDGICIAGPQGVILATQGAYDKYDWQALGVTNSFAAFSEGVYYIFTEN